MEGQTGRKNQFSTLQCVGNALLYSYRKKMLTKRPGCLKQTTADKVRKAGVISLP